MPKDPTPSVFRVAAVTASEPRRLKRRTTSRGDVATFTLSLSMLHAIDEWAARQSMDISRAEAIYRLLEAGLSSDWPHASPPPQG